MTTSGFALRVAVVLLLYACGGLAPWVAQSWAVGALSLRACISSDPATTGCTNIGGTTNGLDGVTESIAISADGKSVYVAVQDAAAVAHFARDSSTGGLSFVDCITGGTTPATGCTDISATTTALDWLTFIALSPDGTSLYTVSSGGVVAHFRRDTATGALSFAACLSSQPTLGCANLGAITNALEGLESVVVSPDGTAVYVMSAGNAVTHLSRDRVSGALSFVDCISGGASPATGCASIGASTALENLQSLVIGPGGRDLYVAATGGDAVTHLTIGAGGMLAFGDCVSDTGAAGCTNIAATASPLAQLASVAVSPDGTSVYSAAELSAVTRFARNPSTGALSFVDCITAGGAPVAGCTNLGAMSHGIGGLESITVSPDSKSVYTASSDPDGAVVHFTRDPATGALDFEGCITGVPATTPCTDVSATTNALQGLQYVAVSPDGASVYATAEDTDTLVYFRRQAAPACSDVHLSVAARPTAIPLVCSDANGDPVTRSIVAGPSNGTLSAIDDASGSVTYTPNAGFTTMDVFSFQAVAGGDSSNIATANLVALLVGNVQVSPAAFRARGRRAGTTFTFELSQAATVTFTIERSGKGRESADGTCQKPSRKNRKGRRCTLFLALGGFDQASQAGESQIAFSGKLGSRPLRPGSYRATLIATDGSGVSSEPAHASFRVRG